MFKQGPEQNHHRLFFPAPLKGGWERRPGMSMVTGEHQAETNPGMSNGSRIIIRSRIQGFTREQDYHGTA